MSNKHQRKIIPNFLIGVILVSTGVLLIIYDIKSRLPQLNKDMIVAGIVIIINTGLYFWGSAFVHKVKSDLIRKQRHRSDKESIQEF